MTFYINKTKFGGEWYVFKFFKPYLENLASLAYNEKKLKQNHVINV